MLQACFPFPFPCNVLLICFGFQSSKMFFQRNRLQCPLRPLSVLVYVLLQTHSCKGNSHTNTHCTQCNSSINLSFAKHNYKIKWMYHIYFSVKYYCWWFGGIGVWDTFPLKAKIMSLLELRHKGQSQKTKGFKL